MAGMNGHQARRAVGLAQRTSLTCGRSRGPQVMRRSAGVLAGLCCVLCLGVGLAACNLSTSATDGQVYLAAQQSLAPRLYSADASATATAAASATAAAAAPTPTTVPTATATAAATATTAPTATTATATATQVATSPVAAGDNGNFVAGVVLIATGALLLLLLVVGLVAYLLVWRGRSDAVLMERAGGREQDPYGGYDESNGGMPAGPDEPTTPFGDRGGYGSRGGPGGWPDTTGGRGYGDPSQRRGDAGGSYGSSQGRSRPPR